jgi:hypothetical protein
VSDDAVTRIVDELKSLIPRFGIDTAGDLESAAPRLAVALRGLLGDRSGHTHVVDLLGTALDRFGALGPRTPPPGGHSHRTPPSAGDYAAVVRMAINLEGTTDVAGERRNSFVIPSTITTYYGITATTSSRWRTKVEPDAFGAFARFLCSTDVAGSADAGQFSVAAPTLTSPSHFFADGEASDIDIVCSEIPKRERPPHASPKDRNYLRYAKFADLDSLVFLKAHLSRLYPAAHVSDYVASEYPEREPDLLLVVGGPPWNSVFRAYARDLPFRFVPHRLGEDDPLVITGVPDEHRPTYHRGRVTSDVAVLVRKNCGPRRWLWMFGGCLTFGVLGACMAAFDSGVAGANHAWLARHLDAAQDDFVVAFRVHRLQATLIAPRFDIEEPIAVLAQASPASPYRRTF